LIYSFNLVHMAAHQTSIAQAQDLIREKTMEKLRKDPKAFGKVTVEITIQDGKIKNIQAIDSTSVKPTE
jgi:hypothetical protein